MYCINKLFAYSIRYLSASENTRFFCPFFQQRCASTFLQTKQHQSRIDFFSYHKLGEFKHANGMLLLGHGIIQLG